MSTGVALAEFDRRSCLVPGGDDQHSGQHLHGETTVVLIFVGEFVQFLLIFATNCQ